MTNAAEPTRWEKLPFSDAPPVARTHARAVSLGAVEPTQDMRVLVVFRPQTPFSLPCQALSRAAYRQKHSTSDAVISRLRTHAETCGLTVERADPAAHLLILRGTCQHAVAAFRPAGLGLYRAGDREFIGREGGLSVPEGMAGDIVAVMGFDHRPVARPHYRRAASPNAASTSYTPPQVAARYGFTSEPGTGQTIGLIELGGGYDATQMADYFHQLGVDRTGRLASVSVGGAGNAPGDPNGADGEVQLDIEVAGSVAPGADLAVYFASNQGSGFYEAVSTAIHDQTNAPDVISISWGGPESGWSAQDMNAMDQAFQSAATLGISVCAASGDSGADDGTSSKVVDFPASSPHVLGCGGTSLPKSGPEVVWNDGAHGGASGGGYSGHFAKPSWQTANRNSMRGVPDVAGNADPETGYQVVIDGQSSVIGGTSAVAPLWAALIAKANQQGTKAGLPGAVLYRRAVDFNDITKGNNNGYSATTGWDPVTGLGSPKGAAIVRLLGGNHAET